jgi:hypothetical protein
MLLSARPMLDVSDVNHFDYTTQAEAVEACDFDVYIQLIDGAVGRYYNPRGRRYIPAALATLQVTLQTIDSSMTVTRAATQPFPEDLSIWKLSLLAADGLVGTFGLQLQLTEGAKVTNGWADSAVVISPKNPSI